LADKIRKIDDYRKLKDEKNEKQQISFSEKTHETDIDDIKIEDPFDFLNPAERAEYMKAHQETLLGVNIDLEDVKKTEKAGTEQEEPEQAEGVKAKNQMKRFFAFRRNRNEEMQDADMQDEDSQGEDIEEEDIRDDDFVEDRATEADYGAASRKEQCDSEEEEEPVDKKEKNSPEKLIRIASSITGILILILLVFIIKVRVIDPFMAGRDDSDGSEFASTVVSGGEQVVTLSGLNLRSSPEATGKDNIVATVSAGTTLTRTGEENGWSEIDYNGRTLYCASKFLQAQN